MIIKEFNEVLEQMQIQQDQEPITSALLYVHNKVLKEPSLIREYQRFYKWFNKTFYIDGLPKSRFKVPITEGNILTHIRNKVNN